MTDVAETDGSRGGRKQTMWTHPTTVGAVNVVRAELGAYLGGRTVSQDQAIRACAAYAKNNIAAVAALLTE